MTHVARLTALAILVVHASAAAAQVAPDADARVPARVPHVRGGDALAVTVLREAATSSPTVARLVADLERTDLIVTIVTGRLPDRADGLAQIVTAAGGVRHVRITLRIPKGIKCLMATLGHELCHAKEIAGMPDVRGEESLAAAYRRIGVPTARDGFFETDAAVRAGEQVGHEIARRPRG
jgi:hypothetical protein